MQGNLENKKNIPVNIIFKELLFKKGIKSLWTGLTPTMGVAIPANLIFFTLYEDFKLKQCPAAAGAEARAAAVIITAPIEYARTNMQASMSNESLNKFLRRTYESRGFLSLWRGAVPALIRDIPFSLVYWDVYERIKTQIDNSDSKIRKMWLPFLNGAVSAALASTITHPFDLLKTRLQSQTQHGAMSIIKSVYKESGIRGFFLGLGPRLGKIIPSCAVMLGTYELTKILMVYEV
eukprot:GHVL01004680.1.p1 GENE.GHVL01004680.1~~GHVL01004680.1.p1  ORF type:complete len:242 (-),score=44.94 GHVL01004680.1:31-735(-)